MPSIVIVGAAILKKRSEFVAEYVPYPFPMRQMGGTVEETITVIATLDLFPDNRLKGLFGYRHIPAGRLPRAWRSIGPLGCRSGGIRA